MAIDPIASQFPIRVVAWNPTTGAAIDPADPALVSASGELVSAAAGWNIPAAGFSNPKYLAADNDDSTGWAITQGGSVVISWSGTYSGPVPAFEQTLDPTGAADWFAVQGENVSLTTGNISSSSTSGAAFVYAAIGVRMRVRMTVLSSGTMVGRVANLSIPASFHMMSSEVHGLSNHDSAVAGAPLQIAGQARDFGTPYTAVSADDVARLVTDLNGNLKVTEENSFVNYTANQTATVVKSGKGKLKRVTVNKKGTVASVVTLWDNTAGSGTLIGTIDSLNLSGSFDYDIAFATGLTITTTGTIAPDVTVIYR